MLSCAVRRQLLYALCVAGNMSESQHIQQSAGRIGYMAEPTAEGSQHELLLVRALNPPDDASAFHTHAAGPQLNLRECAVHGALCEEVRHCSCISSCLGHSMRRRLLQL